MLEIILLVTIGIIMIIIGILNRKGYVKMMHSYHYKRVKKEDVIPFGKQVGLGMIILGSSILINGILYVILYYSKIQIFELIGNIILIICLIISLIIIFSAMFKYNKGIF